jgi:hypothetical protein
MGGPERKIEGARYISIGTTMARASTESDRRLISTVGETRGNEEFDVVSSYFRYSDAPDVLITAWHDQFRCALFTNIVQALERIHVIPSIATFNSIACS